MESSFDRRTEWGLLLVRVVVGISFVLHGLSKFQMGLDQVAGWFASMGIPGFLAYAVAFVELIGGIGLILGAGTRVWAALLAVVIAVATFKVKIANGFLGGESGPGYELELLLLAMLLLLVLAKRSAFSLDHVFASKARTHK
ncbi:DoxX family protein [Brevibacillus ruminantium]|uniref:DoxX family protein n=1 Tax=Brevibacillus ruminantium TaxID=2950604 RepID=A0ABY4WFA6_9BACL|nr:DoxX family protein [Brevibacillus ruminantium]USG65840.1 DoxX family protein [Brevibacillus ruminantium]